MHFCQAFVYPCNFCGSSPTIVNRSNVHRVYVNHHGRISLHILPPSSYPPGATELLFPTQFLLEWDARCGGVLMVGCLPCSSTISPYHDWVIIEIHSEAVIKRVWRQVIMRAWTYTWRLWSSEFDNPLWGHRGANLEEVIVRVQRYT